MAPRLFVVGRLFLGHISCFLFRGPDSRFLLGHMSCFFLCGPDLPFLLGHTSYFFLYGPSFPFFLGHTSCFFFYGPRFLKYTDLRNNLIFYFPVFTYSCPCTMFLCFISRRMVLRTFFLLVLQVGAIRRFFGPSPVIRWMMVSGGRFWRQVNRMSRYSSMVRL